MVVMRVVAPSLPAQRDVSMAPPRRVVQAGSQRPPETKALISRRASLLGGMSLWLRPPALAAARPVEDLHQDCRIEPPSNDALLAPQHEARLFPHGMPRFTDIVQGAFSDCYLLAALASVAHRFPALVKKHLRYISRRPDGSKDYYVSLLWPDPHDRPRTHWMCVNNTFSPHSARRALWVSIYEKAFAKFNQHIRVLPSARPGYEALHDPGGGQGLTTLTGRPATLVMAPNQT